MLPKLVFSCFKLCLLVVLCTAAPAADSDLSSGSDDEGNIVKLKGGADLSELSGTDDVGKKVKLQGEDDDALSSDRGPDEDINAEDKDDASVAENAVGGEKNTDNGVQDDSPDANEESINADEKDTSVAEEPIDGEKHTDNPPKSGEGEHDETTLSPSDVNTRVHFKNRTCDLDKSGVLYCQLNGFKYTPAEKKKFKIWPGAKIPYFIDELSYDKVLRDKIRSYLDEARSRTAILHFEELLEPPAGDDERWVFFVNRRGQLDCKDYNTNSFTTTGVQKVIIGYNCLEHGGPMAAVVLALAGVPPQHNSPDRDRYILVKADHILPEKIGLFRRLKDSDWLFHNVKYDYESVSHYPTHKYTADGSDTIKILDSKEVGKDGSWTYNEKRTYSSADIYKIGLLYDFVFHSMDNRIKPEDCKALYRPGPSFSKLKLKKQKKFLALKKPEKYLLDLAGGNETGADKLLGKAINMQGEALSSLE